MAKQTEAQMGHKLLTDYVSLYELKYNKRPAVNRNKDTYGFRNMLIDMSYDEIVELLKYYFTMNVDGHPLQKFYNNYDKYIEYMEEAAADREHRDRLLKETKERVEKFRADNGR